jgi:Arc/MetJ family transcription regulator
MRTTIEVDRDLLEEAVRVTGAPAKSVAVRLGLKALMDEAARRRLAALRGKIPEVEVASRRWLPRSSSWAVSARDGKQ